MDISEICRRIKDGKITIIAKPNSPKTEIVCFDSEKSALKVNVHAHPEKGKANSEIIKFFSRILKKKVEIVSGITSKTKVLRLF